MKVKTSIKSMLLHNINSLISKLTGGEKTDIPSKAFQARIQVPNQRMLEKVAGWS